MSHDQTGIGVDVRDEFWRLVEVYCAESAKLHDSREREPYLLDILSFAKKYSEDKSVLESCFLQIVGDSRWPLEILEFSMHELKWAPVRECVEDAIRNAKDIREQDALERVLQAFDADWEDADLYQYYS